MKSERLQDSLTPAINFLQNLNQSPNQMKTRWNLIDRIPPKNPWSNCRVTSSKALKKEISQINDFPVFR